MSTNAEIGNATHKIPEDEEKSMTTNSKIAKGCHGLKIPDMRLKVEQSAREQIIERAAFGFA